MWDGLGPVGQETSSTRDGSGELMCLVEHLRTQAAPTSDPGQREQGVGGPGCRPTHYGGCK